MNFKLLLCVGAAVMVGYMAVFHIIDNYRQMKAPHRPPPAEPNFKTTVIHYQDEHGREVERDSQFQVTTKFADPELLKKLPPPPPEK